MTCCPMIVPLTVAVQDEIALSVEDGLCVGLDVDIAFNGKQTEYHGPTSFVPSEEQQTIQTAGYTVREDIIIEPIPSNYGKISWDGRRITVS